jgi:hypothetical protein
MEKRKLRDGLHTVAAGEDKGRDGSGGEGGGDGDVAEVDVDTVVPAAPDLGGCKHVSATAHVAEGSLGSVVGTTAKNARDTGDRTPRAPGLRGGLVAGAPGHRIRLAAVAGQELVDEADDVRADRRAEDVRQWDPARSPWPCRPPRSSRRPGGARRRPFLAVARGSGAVASAAGWKVWRQGGSDRPYMRIGV